MGMRNLRVVSGALGLILALCCAGAAAQNPPPCSVGSTKPCSFQTDGGVTATYLASGNTALTQAMLSGFQSNTSGQTLFGDAGGSGRFAFSTRDTGRSAAGAGSNWNVWASLSQSNVAYKFQPLQSSGHVNVSVIGVDYSFSNKLVLGLAAAWDQTRVGTTFNGGNLNANGNTVAPYLSWRFAPAWSLDGTLGWGRANFSQTDNSVPGGITGNYRDRRALGSLSVSYAKLIGKWQLTGRGSYLASQDRLGQFTLSNGTTINAATVNNGQVRVGGQAMYNGGVVLPYVGLYYFNDVQRTAVASSGGQTPANDRDGFQAQLGVQFAPRGPVYGGLMISSDFGRSQVKNDMILGNIGIRF